MYDKVSNNILSINDDVSSVHGGVFVDLTRIMFFGGINTNNFLGFYTIHLNNPPVQLYGPRTTASASHMLQTESQYFVQPTTTTTSTTTTADTVLKRQQMDDPYSTLAMSQFSFLR
jgi:hypothetical protein